MTETTTLEKVPGAAPATAAPATATPAGKAAPTTTTADAGDPDILGAGGDEGRTITTPATWPEDWRLQMADGDEKLAKRLERFDSPKLVTKSWLASEQKISSGEYKKPLAENATPEQIAEWRKEQGIPETPDKYDITLEGHEWGEADKPLVDTFLAKMHEVNAKPEIVKQALGVYKQIEAEALGQRQDADRAFRATSEDEMRTEWGRDFRPYVDAYVRFLADPEAALEPGGPTWGQLLGTARDVNGNRLVNHPVIVRHLTEKAINKYGTTITNGDGRGITLEDDEAAIRSVMKSDFAKYKAEGMDKKLTAILEKKAKMGRL